MSDARKRTLEAFESHPAFVSNDDGFRVTTTPFEGTVSVSETDEGIRYEVTVRVPMLDAVVEGETVAPVVEGGWFETFALRLEDAHQATRLGDTVDVTVTRSHDTATVRMRFVRSTADGPAVKDAKALIEYVEGTYVEGIVPGYEYGPPVQGLLSRALDYGEEPDGPT